VKFIKAKVNLWLRVLQMLSDAENLIPVNLLHHNGIVY